MIPFYCVSIDEARLAACVQRVRRQFADVEWTPQKAFAKSPEGKVSGCFDSHMQIMRKIVRQKHPWTFIVEDDVQFRQGCPGELWSLVCAAKKADPKTGMVYLGHRPLYFHPDVTVSSTNDPGFRAVGTMDLRAYVIHRDTARHMVMKHQTYTGVPIDVAFAQSHNNGQIRAVAKYPMVVTQTGYNKMRELVTANVTFANFRTRVSIFFFLMFSLLCVGALIGLSVLHFRRQKTKAWIFT